MCCFLYIWLLSRHIIISRIMRAVGCMYHSIVEQCFSVSSFGSAEFVIPFTCWWTVGLFPVMMYIYVYCCLLWVSPKWTVSSIEAETCVSGSLLYVQHQLRPASQQVFTRDLWESHSVFRAFVTFFTESCPVGKGKSWWDSGHTTPKYGTSAY